MVKNDLTSNLKTLKLKIDKMRKDTSEKNKNAIVAHVAKMVDDGKISNTQARIMLKDVFKKTGYGILGDIPDVVEQGVIDQAEAHPFNMIAHPAVNVVEGINNGLRARYFPQIDQDAQNTEDDVTGALGNNFVSNAINSSISSGATGLKNMYDDGAANLINYVGSGKNKKKVGPKKDISWLDFVKTYRQNHPHLPYSECLKVCGPLYRKGKDMVGGGLIDSVQEFLFKHLKNFVSGIAKGAMDQARASRTSNWNY